AGEKGGGRRAPAGGGRGFFPPPRAAAAPARLYIDEVIRLADGNAAPRLRSAALNNLAGIHYQRGALEEALACHRAALSIRMKLEDPEALAQTHKNLGITHYRLGDLSDAERHLEEGLLLYRKTRHRPA